MTIPAPRDPRVTAYIATLLPWQQTYAQQLRDLLHQADPSVMETIKRTHYPYFINDGRNIAALMGAKDHLNLAIFDPIAPDPHRLINQGHANTTARAIQIYEGESLNELALIELFRAVIANNHAGGWRIVKAGKSIKLDAN